VTYDIHQHTLTTFVSKVSMQQFIIHMREQQHSSKGKLLCSNGERRWGAPLPFLGHEPVGGHTTESVMHGQPVQRQTYGYLPSHRATEPKLYCLVTEAHVCV